MKKYVFGTIIAKNCAINCRIHSHHRNNECVSDTMISTLILIGLVVILAFYLILFCLLRAAKQADEIVLFDSEGRESETSSIDPDSLDFTEAVRDFREMGGRQRSRNRTG